MTKTTEQYRQELVQKHRPFLCIGNYIGANTKNLHKCVQCGYEFMATPHVILRTGVCPMCSDIVNTTEKYKAKLKIKRPDMEVLEEYQGPTVKILHRHSCGYEYKISPNHVLNNSNGCENCYRVKRRKTNEEFSRQIQFIRPKYKYIGEYQHSQTKIKVICNKGHEYYAYPYNIIQGHGCKRCSDIEKGIRCRLTSDEYQNRIQQSYPNIELLSDYITADAPIKYKCTICGIESITGRAYSLLQYGCNCNRPNGEQVIAQYLTRNNIEFISQMKFDGLKGYSKKLSYDFYIPSLKLLVEYQGAQHERAVEHFGGEEQFKKQQEYDKRKRKYADENGYNLLYIWYYEYDDIDDILDKCLKSKSVETAGQMW